jgi:hypothetical protein
MSRRRRSVQRVAAAAVVSLLGISPAFAQSPASPAAPFKVLAEQVASLFPVVQTEVVEAAGGQVTLASGRSQGMQPGLELVAYREGRELYHPTTRKRLGRTEETLGRLAVVQVQENYSLARVIEGGAGLGPGDKARVPAGKLRLAVVALSSGPRSRLTEAAAYELIQELERAGRFQIVFGDQIGAWLAQERISPEQFTAGRGVREAIDRFKVSPVLVLHFTTVQGKPFMDARVFAASLDTPLLQNAFFVPPSVRSQPSQAFSSSGAPDTVRVERRSLLARLLSGDFEPNTYSAGAASIPIRQVATFPFPVVAMDVAVGPQDKIPRIVVTEGQRVFVYRLQNQVLEAQWTFDKRMVGRILSVQFADLDGDGVLDVVVNRQDAKSGMLSYILTTRDGRAHVLADEIPLLLLAVDEQGDGLNKGLWAQTYHRENFWTQGTATRHLLKGDQLVAGSRVRVPDAFRPTGATFASPGKERVLAFVDESNRLRLALGSQDLWRSVTVVGKGPVKGHLQIPLLQTIVDKFFAWEPNPVAVDLDGDGIQEIVVPVNEDESGRMAVVFRGPAGFRMQVVNSGFEGMVTGLGAIPGEAGPSLVAAVLKRTGLFKQGGETQIIMTVPEP